ncbi:MAG: hypothetical protein QOD54_1899, partial [Sphingomonadales bacterium]|nr:hypothetical protein [Sphingomonadales bacterium]
MLVAVFAAPAAAAGWLPAVNVSVPSPTSTAQTSTVASDTAGESFATYADTDGTNTRIMLASHLPGLPWSAPAPVSDAGQSASSPALSLSTTGFGAIAWIRSDGTKNRIEVSRRVPGGGFGAPSIVSAPGVDASNPVVGVDRAGDIETAWIDANNVVHARRFSAASGSWSPTIDDLTPPVAVPANQMLWFLTLVMSPSGNATAAWVFDTNPAGTGAGTADFNIQSRTQDASGTWLAMVQPTASVSPTSSGRPQLAVADDGTVTMVWMDYTTSSCGFLCVQYATATVRAQTRSAGGTWGSAQTLSAAGVISDSPTVATTPAGETTVVWTESAANAVKALTRTVGGAFPVASAATIITPQDRAISSGTIFGIPLSTLHLTATALGTVATFTRTDGSNYRASAVFRPGGGQWPNPLTGLATLAATGSDSGLDVSAGIDGLGNVVTAWSRANVIQSATLDVSPPTFTALNVPAAGTTGQPVAMSATTFDVWSALDLGATGWSFGDGGTAAGASVSHVFAAPGIYTVTVGANDTAGNVATPALRQIVISNAPVPPLPTTTIATPKANITWKAGKLKNSSLTLSGTVGGPASLTITMLLHGTTTTAARSTFAATAGAWSTTLKLPATLAPGPYDITVGGPLVQPSQTS